MRAIVALGLASVLIGLLCASPYTPARADAPDPHELLRRGVQLQREASWNASIAALERARTSAALSLAERAECAFYLAAAYVAIGSDAAARREIALVLELQPGFEPPPYTSPKVASLLGELTRERANASVLEPRPPRTRVDGALGTVLELGFEARRARLPIYGVVRHRLRGDKGYASAPLVLRQERADGSFMLYAEVRPARAGVVEYYADALSAIGPLGAGSAERPLELPLARVETPVAPPGPKRGPSPWIWAAIPIGVVAGTALGLGLYYGLRAREP